MTSANRLEAEAHDARDTPRRYGEPSSSATTDERYITGGALRENEKRHTTRRAQLWSYRVPTGVQDARAGASKVIELGLLLWGLPSGAWTTLWARTFAATDDPLV